MGLAYFSIFVTILGAAGIAVVLLKAAWEIWKKARFKILAMIPLLLGGFCAFFAVSITFEKKARKDGSSVLK